MPRVTRLRWTDWLGLVGLALLFAWTPAYVAQDPAERTLTGGQAYTLPLPHDGDRAVLDLVVTLPDGTVHRYPGVMEIRIDTEPIPNAELVGIPTVYRLTVVHQAVNISWPGGQLIGPETTRSEWFDASGLRVWGGSSMPAHAPDAPYGHDVGGRAWSCSAITHLNDYAGQTFHYEPATISAVLRELRGGIQDGLNDDGCGREGGGGYLRVVNRAYESDTGLLFGRHLIRGDRMYDQAMQNDADPHRTCPITQGEAIFDRYYGSKYFGSHERFSLGTEDRITFTTDTESRCDFRDHFERWDWISPDFPYPVGHHARHHDESGDLLMQVDLLPGRIERGDGDALPIAQRPDTVPHLVAPVVSHPRPTQSLGSLGSDDTPLVHGLTLAELDRRVRADAPAGMAAFLDAGASLVAWGVRSDEVNGTADNDATRWHLTYAQPDGERRTATALLQRTPTVPDGTLPLLDRATPVPPASAPQTADAWTHQVFDACSDEQVPTAEFPIHCDAADPSATDPDRAITDLGWLIPRIDAYSDSPYGSLRTPVHPSTAMISFEPWNSQELDTRDGMQRHDQPILHWELDRHVRDEPHTIFAIGGRHDMTTGTAESLGHSYRASSDDARPALTPTSGTVQPRPGLTALDPIETTVAVSGLLLASLAVLSRLLAATKSGAAAAFAAGLYAKIRHEDVLLHERRDAITAALRAEPGLTAKEVAARIEAGWGATVHHLETLRRSGLVTRIVVGRNRHHFLAKETTPTERRLTALRRDPAYAAFLDVVLTDPGRSLDEIAAALPRSMSGLSRTGARLEREGVVQKRKEGRTVRFYPTGDT